MNIPKVPGSTSVDFTGDNIVFNRDQQCFTFTGDSYISYKSDKSNPLMIYGQGVYEERNVDITKSPDNIKGGIKAANKALGPWHEASSMPPGALYITFIKIENLRDDQVYIKNFDPGAKPLSPDKPQIFKIPERFKGSEYIITIKFGVNPEAVSVDAVVNVNDQGMIYDPYTEGWVDDRPVKTIDIDPFSNYVASSKKAKFSVEIQQK